MQPADIPSPQSATLGLHHVAHKLLLIPGRCVHPGLVCRRQVAAAVGKTAGHSSCSAQGPRSVGGTLPSRRDFAVAGPATWNSLPVDLRTSSLSRDTFAKKTQNSFIWLRALLRSSFIGRYTNRHIHSFIHTLLIFCNIINPQCPRALLPVYLQFHGITYPLVLVPFVFLLREFGTP